MVGKYGMIFREQVRRRKNSLVKSVRAAVCVTFSCAYDVWVWLCWCAGSPRLFDWRGVMDSHTGD